MLASNARFQRLLTIPVLLVAATCCGAQTSDDRAAMQQEIHALRQRLDELEHRLQAADQKPVEVKTEQLVAPAPPASVAADTTGFTIKSADDNFSLKIGADLQVDNRTYTGSGSSAYTDGILLRR